MSSEFSACVDKKRRREPCAASLRDGKFGRALVWIRVGACGFQRDAIRCKYPCDDASQQDRPTCVTRKNSTLLAQARPVAGVDGAGLLVGQLVGDTAPKGEGASGMLRPLHRTPGLDRSLSLPVYLPWDKAKSQPMYKLENKA